MESNSNKTEAIEQKQETAKRNSTTGSTRVPVISLVYTKSRLAKIIRIVSTAILIFEFVLIFLLGSNLVEYLPLQFQKNCWILTGVLLIIALLKFWLLNAFAEPFEDLCSCADSLRNIEVMTSAHMEMEGKAQFETNLE